MLKGCHVPGRSAGVRIGLAVGTLAAIGSGAIAQVNGATNEPPGGDGASEVTVELTPLGPVPGRNEQPVFSPDFGRAAILATQGSRQVVMVDGVAGPPFSQIIPAAGIGLSAQPAIFSPDSLSFAYIGDRGGREQVVVSDGRVGPAYEHISGLQYSPVGHRLAYVGGWTEEVDTTGMNAHEADLALVKARRWVAVIDGQPGPVYHSVGAFQFSPDGRHYAYIGDRPDWSKPAYEVEGFGGKYWAQPRTQRVVVDGQPGPWYPHIPSLRFSPDGSSVAYVVEAKAGGDGDGKEEMTSGGPDPRASLESFLVVNGQEGPRFSGRISGLGPNDQIMLSEDGRHHGYIVDDDGRFALVVDGKQVVENRGAVQQLTLSPDCTRWAYTVEEKPQNNTASKKTFVYVDGERSLDYASCEGIVFSPDSEHVAYVVKAQSGKSILVFDGEESAAYDSVGLDSVRFSPDGSRMAYVASTGRTSAVVVVDGEPGPEFGTIHQDALRFSEDGKSIIYEAFDYEGNQTSHRRLVVDHKVVAEEPAAPNATFVAFSPDGSRVAYVSSDGRQQQIMLDGEPRGPGVSSVQSLSFSPDGEHLGAIVTTRKDSGDAQFQVFLDGRLGPAQYRVDRVDFSPDGDRLVTVGVIDETPESQKKHGQAPRERRQVLVGERPIGVFDRILERQAPGPEYRIESFAFHPDGSLQFFAVRGDTLYRVRLGAESMAALPTIDDLLAGQREKESLAARGVWMPEPGLNVLADGLSQTDNLIIADDGTLYFTTAAGGTYDQGAIYRLDQPGAEPKVLHEFLGRQHDGNAPASLVLGADGMLYGSLAEGGQHNAGSVYRLATDGSGFEVLRHFEEQADGRMPLVVSAGDGAVYGVSNAGVPGWNAGGKLFRIDGGDFSILYDAERILQLIEDRRNHAANCDRLAKEIEQWRARGKEDAVRNRERLLADAEAELAKVTDALERAGGETGGALGRMIDGKDGFFYGVTSGVAYAENVRQFQGPGLFRIGHDGTRYTVLHRFEGAPLDGQRAEIPPVLSEDGSLYGVTPDGGIAGRGVVYRLDPSGPAYTVLANPKEMPNNLNPPPAEGPDGSLYLTNRSGTLFRGDKGGGELALVEEGLHHMASFVRFRDGLLYGHTGSPFVRGGEAQIVCYAFDAPTETAPEGAGGEGATLVVEVERQPAPVPVPEDIPVPSQQRFAEGGDVPAAAPAPSAPTLNAEKSITYDGMRIKFSGGDADVAELKAAAEGGNTRACLLLGELTGQGKIPGGATEAVGWFERGHELGDVECTARLAMQMLLGRGVEESDPRRGAKNIRHLAQVAAGGESPLGLYLYAECIAKGIGAQADADAAEPYYTRAASLGHPLAVKWCKENGVSFDSD